MLRAGSACTVVENRLQMVCDLVLNGRHVVVVLLQLRHDTIDSVHHFLEHLERVRRALDLLLITHDAINKQVGVACAIPDWLTAAELHAQLAWEVIGQIKVALSHAFVQGAFSERFGERHEVRLGLLLHLSRRRRMRHTAKYLLVLEPEH